MKKIRYDRCYNDIGVVLATKLRHYLFYLQPYFSALGGFFFFKKIGQFDRNLRERYRDILG